MVNAAFDRKLKDMDVYGTVTNKFWDVIVMKNFKAILGGNVKYIGVGSAPIEKSTLDFLKAAFCCPIIEAYGMSETSATGCMSQYFPNECGTIGGPSPSVKIKLKDLPELGYSVKDEMPRGEILMKGGAFTKGYFLNPEKTEELFEDGWLRSGDVGIIMPNGSLNVIDRAKNIFKLSQGEYIAPEKL